MWAEVKTCETMHCLMQALGQIKIGTEIIQILDLVDLKCIYSIFGKIFT